MKRPFVYRYSLIFSQAFILQALRLIILYSSFYSKVNSYCFLKTAFVLFAYHIFLNVSALPSLARKRWLLEQHKTVLHFCWHTSSLFFDLQTNGFTSRLFGGNTISPVSSHLPYYFSKPQAADLFLHFSLLKRFETHKLDLKNACFIF